MNAFFGRAAGAILSLSLLSAPAAQAQDAYPNKPVKVIVHTLPGASSDVLARAVSKAMGDQLGQSFVVENRSRGRRHRRGRGRRRRAGRLHAAGRRFQRHGHAAHRAHAQAAL